MSPGPATEGRRTSPRRRVRGQPNDSLTRIGTSTRRRRRSSSSSSVEDPNTNPPDVEEDATMPNAQQDSSADEEVNSSAIQEDSSSDSDKSAKDDANDIDSGTKAASEGENEDKTKNEDDEASQSSTEDIVLSQLTSQSKGKRKQLSTMNNPTKARGSKKKDDESDEEYIEDEDEQSSASSEGDGEEAFVDSEDDNDTDDYASEKTVKKKQTKIRKSRAPQRGRKPRKEFKSEVSSSSDESSVAPTPSKSRKRAAPQTARKPSKTVKPEDSSEDGSSSKNLKRQSPRRSKQVTIDVESSSDFSEGENDDTKRTKPSKPQAKRRKKTPASSDEEYSGGSSSESSSEEEEEEVYEEEEEEAQELDEDESLVGDAEISEGEEVVPSAKSNLEATNIDEEKIGDADESSSSSEDEVELLAKKSPAKSKKGRKEILPSQATLSSSDGDDSDAAAESPQKSNKNNNNNNNNSRLDRFPPCPSTEDAITCTLLPKKHICFISPDGSSRQCFALETLRMAAIKCSHRTTRTDNTGEQHMNFLQPPHFRSPMSDNLLGQIASKFGRDAMDPQSSFYNRKQNKGIGSFFDGGDADRNDPDYVYDYDADDFVDHVNRYVDKQMGSQDVYVCPLCYREVHHRVNRIDRIASNDDDDYFMFVDKHDPMMVLGWPDNDKFEMASLFCFKRVVQLKKHLQEVHGIDTKEVAGNDLYKQYKVRDSDALLQRWIKKTWKPKSGGVMQHYWYSGYNQSFVYLLDNIRLAESYREILDSAPSEVGEAAEYLSKIQDFADTFQDKAKKLWEYISAPFGKGQDDIRNWLDDDNVEEENGEFSHSVAMRAMDTTYESDQNDFTHKLERKYAESSNYHEKSDSDDHDDKSASSSSLEIVDAPKNDGESDARSEAEEQEEDNRGYYSEVEEENDDWVLQRKQRPTRSLKETRTKSTRSNSEEGAESATLLVGTTPSTPTPLQGDNDDEDDVVLRTTSSKKRRRIVVEEDDD
ncbi:MAG: hypothetical protein SGBAC_007317 [Bacillariaceae sp.]